MVLSQPDVGVSHEEISQNQLLKSLMKKIMTQINKEYQS